MMLKSGLSIWIACSQFEFTLLTGPSDLMEHNLKLVLGLIWTLILRYKLHLSPSPTTSSKADIDTKGTLQVKISIRKILLQWISGILKGSHITNFTTDWNDGIHLSALIDYCQPGLLPSHASLSKDKALQNIVHAMKLAEEHFGIPQVMQPEDLAIDKPDELSVMTYLSYFCSSGSPGEKALLLWVQQQVATLNLTITNLTTDWTDGRVLGALVNVISGGGFPEYEQMSPENGMENCRKSIDAAEKLLGVTKMIEPEEFSSSHLDQLRRMAYLAQFYRAMHAQAHGSPLTDNAAAHKVEVGQLQYPEETGIGRVVSIDLDCSQAGSGVVRAEVVGNICGTFDVKVDMIGPDSYRVKFEPLKPDVYILSIYYGKNQVNGSPFSINLHLPEAGKVQHLGTSLPKDSKGPVALQFDTKEAGRGKLMVQASGESVGTIPINIEAKANGTYNVSFIPPYQDIYTVDVHWAWGTFNAHTAGALVGPIPTELEQKADNSYKVSFRPPLPDVYTVDVIWERERVPGSPFVISLLPPAQPEKVICGLPIYTEIGKPTHLPIDVSSAGFGKVTASCKGVESGEIPVKIVGPVKKPCGLTFVPPRNDFYLLSVFYDGIEIQGSPFRIDLQKGILDLPGLKEEIEYPIEVECGKAVIKGPNEPVDMLIDISKAGKGTLTAQCSGEECGDVPVNITSTFPMTHKVSFVPQVEDVYKLSVFFNASEVKNSPFYFNLRPAMMTQVSVEEVLPPGKLAIGPECDKEEGNDGAMVLSVGSEETKGLASKELTNYIGTELLVEVKVHKAEQATAKVKATAVGDNSGPTEIKVVWKSEDRFLLIFNPEQVDRYTIEATLDDKPIPNSFFIVNYIMPPADASKVKLIGLPPRVVNVNQEVTMTVDAQQAGEGKLYVSCEHPTTDKQSPKLEVIPIEGEAHMFHVKYIPTASGNHQLSFKWAEEQIPNSPVSMVAVDLATAQRITYGKPVGIDFDTKHKERDLKAYAIYEGDKTGAHLKVKMHRVQKSKHHLSFHPKESGLYYIHILVKDMDIPGSPFVVMYGEPPMPGAVKVEIPSDTGYVGEVTRFSIDTKEAGGGELNIGVTVDGGKETGSLSVEDRKDGSYSVVFTPIAPGKHQLYITWSGQEVPGNPFSLIVRDRKDDLPISKITVLDHIPTYLQVNHEVSFRVDTRTAGQGDLTVTAERPYGDLEPPDVEVNTSKEDPQIYEVSYTPTVAGIHKLHIKWAGETIPATPISIVVKDIITFPYGQPVWLDINANCKTGDLESYAIHQESGNRYKVKISKKEKGKFKLTLDPKEYGLYCINVLIRQKEITGSPFVVRYDKAAQPEKCVVVDMPVSGYVKKVVAFRVETREAGSGVLNVKATGPAGSKKAKLKVKKRKDGTYTVEYTPTAAGDHSFVITWGGVAIPGSPFQIPIQEAKMETIEYRLPIEVQPPLIIDAFVEGEEVQGQPQEPREITLSVGTPLIVVVKTKDKKGTLTSTALGKRYGFTDVRVSQPKSNTFEAFLNPSIPDRYTLKVKLNGENLPRTPFIVHYILPPTDASKCRILEVENIPMQPQPNREIHFKVDCNGAGQGVLKIISGSPITSKESGKLEAKPTEKDPHVFDISYTPAVPGLHILELLWSEKTIPGSPLYLCVEKEEVLLEREIKGSFQGTRRLSVLKEFRRTQKFGDPVQFHLSTIHAGTGSLRFSCTGPGKAEVKVIDNKDGVYSCEFRPTVAGKYQLNILWNEEHIKGSPYLLNFPSSQKSLAITGLELEYVDFHIGVPYAFQLDCEGVGKVAPRITSRPQNAAKINLKQAEGGRNHYRCEIIPLVPGNHEISVQYDHVHILGSPFNVYFDPTAVASKCQVIRSLVKPGEEGMSKVQLCVSTEGAGEGELEASVRDVATKEPLTIDISKSTGNEKHYMLEFSIKQEMECLVSITYDQQHIHQSPFKLSFASPQGAACCRTEGEGLKSLQVGKWSQFIVSTADAGEGELSVKIEKEGEKLEPSKLVSPLSDNRYEVRYLPTHRGIYIITVLWAKQHIPGSPFKVRCYNPGHAHLLSISEPVTETYIGEPLQLTVKAESVTEEGELEITLHSQTETISGQGMKGKDGNYTCTVHLSEPAKYTAHVRWNGEDIRGSPFSVKVMTPPKPENVRASGPGLSNGYVGQEGNFMIETGGGGPGVLAVDVQGLKGAFKLHMRRHPDNNRTVLVRYNPIDAGPYVIDVLWSGVHIPGSPFKVNIAEQEIPKELGMSLRVSDVYLFS